MSDEKGLIQYVFESLNTIITQYVLQQYPVVTLTKYRNFNELFSYTVSLPPLLIAITNESKAVVSTKLL